MSKRRFQVIGILWHADVELSRGKHVGQVCRYLGFRSRPIIVGARNMAV
jgi:hypothetical protein